jgi:rod shape-determining protein MreC
VAKVAQVDRRADSAFARISLQPLSKPDSTRHVLLLEPTAGKMPERPADAASASASAAEPSGRHGGKGHHNAGGKPAPTATGGKP